MGAQKVDVVIIGAGFVGGILALQLLSQGFRVCLVEKKKLKRPSLKESGGRAFALSSGVVEKLKQLSFWDGLDAYASPIKEMQLSRASGGGVLSFSPQSVGLEKVGVVLNEGYLRAHLRKKLLEKASGDRNFFLVDGDSVTEKSTGLGSVKVFLENGPTFEARLVVNASGRHSSGQGAISWDYRQKALVFQVGHTLPHHNVAFEHFAPDGPLAFLPLKGNLSGVVWSLDTKRAEALASQPKILLNSLIQHFGWGLGDLTLSSEILSYPLTLYMPYAVTGHRQVFMGDAAHGIHPVAGQGLNLGLRDAFCLARSCFDLLSVGIDIGSTLALERYARLRGVDRWSMAGLTHLFAKGFQLSIAAPFWDGGTTFLKMLPGLQNKIMRHAMS